MQKVRCHPLFFSVQKTPTACKLLISGSISLPFSGFFSPFPRGTCSLSVRTTYLEIRGWYPDVRWIITSPTDLVNSFFDFTGLTPSLASVSSDFKSFLKETILLFRFRSPLLTKSLLIYFPQVTKMFQFTWFFSMRVSPFGYLYFAVPSVQFSLFASFRVRPRHPWEALSFLLFLVHCILGSYFHSI